VLSVPGDTFRLRRGAAGYGRGTSPPVFSSSCVIYDPSFHFRYHRVYQFLTYQNAVTIQEKRPEAASVPV